MARSNRDGNGSRQTDDGCADEPRQRVGVSRRTSPSGWPASSISGAWWLRSRALCRAGRIWDPRTADCRLGDDSAGLFHGGDTSSTGRGRPGEPVAPAGGSRIPDGRHQGRRPEPFAIVQATTLGMAEQQDVPHRIPGSPTRSLRGPRSTGAASMGSSYPRAGTVLTITARAGPGAPAARKATSPTFTTSTAMRGTISSPSSTPITFRSPAISWQMLRPFADPKVGYVSAPSICDSNAAESWSARGTPLCRSQHARRAAGGYNGNLAPLCIGSHYADAHCCLEDRSAASGRSSPRTTRRP